MPSSTPERQEKWIDDNTAMQFLFSRGYKLTRLWLWLLPEPDHIIDKEENDAMCYLVEEWDFGGYVTHLFKDDKIIQRRIDG